MSFSTIEHSSKCSPVSPCTNCRGTSFLRTWMLQGDFNVFRMIIGEIHTECLPKIDASIAGGSCLRSLGEKQADIHHVETETGTRLETMAGFDELPIRIHNCLRNEGIVTTEQLLQTTKKELLCIHNFGQLSLNALLSFLENHGYGLE